MSYGLQLKIIIISFIFLTSYCGFTQDVHIEESHQPENGHHHKKNEVSIALGVVPLPDEDKITAGIHLHYVRGIGHSNRFGVGIGFETILDEHKHYTISAVFQYRIYKGLIFGYGPGLLIKKENSETELQFAQHIELAYEFDLGKFHIGPMVEVGIERNNVHYMLGVHFGIDF